MKNSLTLVFCLFFVCLSYGQAQSISGVVTDKETGVPIPGANIAVQNTTRGVVTDFDGNYVLEAGEGEVLIFSYIGYKEQQVVVGTETVIDVQLSVSASELEEVVVVGYGTQKKENLTGSVNQIKTNEIEGKATTSLTNALQGISPGLTVISRPGNVGSDMGSINVRGRGNLGTSSPLFVVDGIPVSASDFQRINPSDVASISVLKDAAASAIYGSRAAYGVLLVTTKKGKDGKAAISYNTYYGVQTPTYLPNKLGSFDYATLINEANMNAGKSPVYSPKEMEIIKSGSQPDLYPNNDWYDLVYRNSAPMTEHNISVSGGGDTRYFVSGTFFDQSSLIPGSELDRYSFRANTERDFGEKLTVGTNISFVREDIERAGAFSTTDLNRMTPLTVARHSDGSWGSVTGGKVSSVLAENNPLRRIAEYGWQNQQRETFIGALNASYKITDELSIRGIGSYKSYNYQINTFDNEVDPITNF